MTLIVKTKSIYEKRVRSDGTRILVTRFYPRGVKRTHFDLWIRNASPESKLLKDYRNNSISWREFSKKFRIQIRSSIAGKEAISQLVELGKKGRITLLCYEQEGKRCHRHIVKAIIESKIREQRQLSIRARRQVSRSEALRREVD